MAKYRNGHPYHPRYEPVDGHLLSTHPLYPIWGAMIGRCENADDPRFADYGGRGIAVCARWRNSFANFVSDMGQRPTPKHSLDRKDNNKGYDKTNCRWATTAEQSSNRRIFSNNTTGYIGVKELASGRFAAQWSHEGRRYLLGRFATAQAAALARNEFIVLFYTDPVAAMKMTERRARCDSSTGVRGISPHSDGGYVIRKTVDGVRKHLGYRKTYEEALTLWTEHN